MAACGYYYALVQRLRAKLDAMAALRRPAKGYWGFARAIASRAEVVGAEPGSRRTSRQSSYGRPKKGPEDYSWTTQIMKRFKR
jgi:hypothetical protein